MPRTLELPLHEGTIRDLIVAHLYSLNVIRDTEAVISLTIGKKVDGCRMLKIGFDKETDVIFHPQVDMKDNLDYTLKAATNGYIIEVSWMEGNDYKFEKTIALSWDDVIEFVKNNKF